MRIYELTEYPEPSLNWFFTTFDEANNARNDQDIKKGEIIEHTVNTVHDICHITNNVVIR